MKVYLYEDSSACLYLHKQDAADVYCHIELYVPYGATFQQDASEIADGVEPDQTVERIPFAQLEAIGDPVIRKIAVWTDGKIHRLATPGPNSTLYLRDPHEFDSNDAPYPEKA